MKKIAILVLTGLVIGIVAFTGCGIPQEQLDVVKADLAKSQTENTVLLAEKAKLEQSVLKLNTQVSELEKEIAELNRVIKALQTQESVPIVPLKEVVGTATIMDIHTVVKKFYPKTNAIIGYQGPSTGKVDYFPLASLETLRRFLATDRTDFLPRSWEWSENYADELAFRLKDQWIKAGLPPHSLGLLKGKRKMPTGEGFHWRNIFVTLESGKVTLYEVVAKRDEIIKVEELNADTYFVIILNIM